MISEKIKNARIFILDDQISNLELLESVLEQFEFVNIKSLTDPRKFFVQLEEYNPDIILLDLMMPYVDGYTILNQLRENPNHDKSLPVLVLTSDATNAAREKALLAGAKDFLNKPFDINEIYLRICNLLETRFLYQELEKNNEQLKEQVEKQTEHLRIAYDELIKANNELRQLDQAKLHFLKIISHEIRTPLNGIKGFSEMLRMKIESEEVLEFLGYLEKSVERLEDFSYQALLITQLQSNSYKTEKENIFTGKIVKDIINKFAEIIAGKRLILKGLDELEKESFLIDSELFNYLIKIVVSNAVKYSFEDETIHFTVKSEVDTQCLIISNIGPDLPQTIISDKHIHLFGLNQKHTDQNTGLDITLTRLIMQAHQGTVEYTNNQPTGAIVKLIFPNN